MSRKTNENAYVPVGKPREKTKYEIISVKLMLPKASEMLKAAGAAAGLALTVILILLITGLRLVTVKEANGVTYRYFGWLSDGAPVAGSFHTSAGVNARVGGGKIKYSDGSVYRGEMKGFMKNGQGTLTFSDGSEYDGEFENDLYSGNGKLTYADGSFYEGGFSEGKFDGNGRYEGTVYAYSGQYEGGERSGQGVMTYRGGDKFEGLFANDMRSEGVYTYKTGEALEGVFDNNAPSPSERMIYTDSAGDTYKVTYDRGTLKNKQAYTRPEKPSTPDTPGGNTGTTDEPAG